MFERIKDCLCHPRWIGKYYKDKVGIILLMIFLFFSLYLIVFGVRCYTEEQFGEGAYRSVASAIVRQEEVKASFQNNKITGKEYSIREEGFSLYILPQDTKAIMKNQSITNAQISILLFEDYAEVFMGSFKLSSFEYKDLQLHDFAFQSLCENDVDSIYYFKCFIAKVLDSASFTLQTLNFGSGIFSAIMYYLMIVLCSSILATLINPTIDRSVRFKFVFYDGLIYFVMEMFAYLFNIGWLSYVALAMPIIYVFITFRHIIKVKISS